MKGEETLYNVCSENEITGLKNIILKMFICNYVESVCVIHWVLQKKNILN